jgi:hypothetical protein
MEALGGLLALVAVAGFILSLVALIRPLPKLGLKSRKRAALAVVGSVILMGVSGSLLPDPPPSNSSPAKEKIAEKAEPDFVPLGQPVQVGDAAVTIKKVETRKRVGIEYAYENASEGGVLVVVHFALKNTGAKPLAAYKQPDVKLVDGAGTEYGWDVAKTGSYSMERGDLNRKLVSDLNPGITVQDAKVFEVSAEQFDPKTWKAIVGRQKVALTE